MIGLKPEVLEIFHDEFYKAIKYEHLTAEEKAECDFYFNSTTISKFPGAVLLDIQSDKIRSYYAIASSAADWQRLRPLLMAFAGPSLTSFNGWPELFVPKTQAESVLYGGNFNFVVRLTPGAAPRSQKVLQRLLSRLICMVTSAPETTQTAPHSTSRLLAQFVDSLNGSNRTRAEQVLEILRNEMRVDALNLSFLWIQLFQHFCDWKSIYSMPEFDSLCHTRKPHLVAEALIEALFFAHMSPIESESSLGDQLNKWNDGVRPLVKRLIRLPITPSCGEGAMTLIGLEALHVQPRRLDLESSVLSHPNCNLAVKAMLETSGRTGSSSVPVMQSDTSTGIVAVQQALTRADSEETLASIRDAFAKIENLDENSKRELLKAEQFRSLWQSMVVATGDVTPPTGWIDWLSKLSDPQFTAVYSTLDKAVVEWPVEALIDSVEISTLAKAISNVPDTNPAISRLADSLPKLVAWSVADSNFPRAALLPLYDALFYHLVVGARRAGGVLDSAAVLIRAMLGIGLSSGQYELLLNDCMELTGDGVGTRNVYWLLDVVEEVMANQTPSTAHRQKFLAEVYGRLISVRLNLSPLQLYAVGKLGRIIGWPDEYVQEFELRENSDSLSSIRSALSGMTIGIYSLTESAAKQAAQALKAIAPDVKISLSSDTCGTQSLRAISQNADIFVIVTASAKHAATGFIQQNRSKERPTLYASGRGFTSIVRAVETYCLK